MRIWGMCQRAADRRGLGDEWSFSGACEPRGMLIYTIWGLYPYGGVPRRAQVPCRDVILDYCVVLYIRVHHAHSISN